MSVYPVLAVPTLVNRPTSVNVVIATMLYIRLCRKDLYRLMDQMTWLCWMSLNGLEVGSWGLSLRHENVNCRQARKDVVPFM